MPWMRISIGVGLGAVVAGVAGMMLWIHDGSHFFDLAVAVAMAGFLTLTSCMLTRVFGSSHGSQDDAFRRGRSMGYDAGFLEGHRTARPVVVPLRLVGREAELRSDAELSVHDDDDDSDSAQEQDIPMPAAPIWPRNARWGVNWWDRWDRGSVWARERRTPLLGGTLALGVIGVLTASMLTPTSASTVTSEPLPGTLFNRDLPSSPATPALVSKPRARSAVANITAGAPGAPPVTANVAAVPAAPASAGASVAATGTRFSPNSTAGAGAADPVTIYLPAVVSPVTVPAAAPAAAAPVAVAPVVPLTAAEQTAANAKAAADLTAANAAAAAAETARVAAAAAEATRLQALADAYAVAHPGG